MTLRSVGLVVASFVLASGLYGCATSPGSTGSAKVAGENDFCTWTFSRDNHTGKVIAATLKVAATKSGHPEGTCSVEESEHMLFISDKEGQAGKRVLSIGPAEFTLEGEKRPGERRTCKYCYVNSAGGISCVYYPC